MNGRGNRWGLWYGPLVVAAISLTAAPSRAQQADIETGKAKFQQLCASCHGTEGKGNGPAAANLPVKLPDYTDPKVMGTLKDEEMTKAIKLGGPAVNKSPVMPAWGGQFSDQEIQNIVAYIRSLSKPGKK